MIGAGGRVIANPLCSALVVEARFAAFEGAIEPVPFFRIGMALGRATPVLQDIGGARVEGLWHPGTLIVTPPGATGRSANQAVRMMGLAVDCRRWSYPDFVTGGPLFQAAARFHRDALLASVMTALLREAEVHGASSAFFEHGIALIVKRLLELPSPPERRVASALTPARFARVTARIESGLAGDLSVTDLAVEAGLEVSGFSRAFRATTGMTPYAYITQRRMERAKQLLATRQSVAGIALVSGYANPAKFAAAFRKVMGLSPSQWRKTLCS